MPPGCATDLDAAWLVGCLGEAPKGKAAPGPMFWRWRELRPWLLAPPRADQVDELDAAFGHRPLIHERRTHVAIEPGSQTAGAGQIFSTDGLRFAARAAGREERLAITFQCDDERLRAGGVQCGGERRLSFLRQARAVWPAWPEELAIPAGQLARVVLLTPAIFAQGAAPEAVRGARVIASAVPRAEVLSGWDFERDAPKPTRRMAPAGSVYWVEISKDVDARRWAQEVWMQCISDDEQDRLDGFGLAVVGRA